MQKKFFRTTIGLLVMVIGLTLADQSKARAAGFYNATGEEISISIHVRQTYLTNSGKWFESDKRWTRDFDQYHSKYWLKQGEWESESDLAAYVEKTRLAIKNSLSNPEHGQYSIWWFVNTKYKQRLYEDSAINVTLDWVYRDLNHIWIIDEGGLHIAKKQYEVR